VAEALSNLGEVLYEEGDFENAERNYRQALALRQKLFGDEHPDVILSLRQLAQLYVMRNEFAKGEKAYEEVLALQKKTFGEEHPEIASSLHGLALARGMQGDFAASQALEEQALAMRRKLYPAEHLALAESLNQLGTLAAVRGELAEAGSLLDTALTMLKKLERTNSLEAVSVLWALGWVRQQAGEPTAGALRDQAISLGLQDLTLTRALTDTIHDFADLLKVRGRSADAEPLLLEAWSCWEKFRAPEKTLKWRRTALERLVRFYEETSRPDQATEWRRKLEALGRDENAPRLTTPEPPQ
jgi:tetratricopeptide (TPR) repeat protein